MVKKLQLLRASSVRECIPDKEGNRKPVGFGLSFGSMNDRKVKSIILHGLDEGPFTLHPWQDSSLRFFKRPTEGGSSLLAVKRTSSLSQ